MIEPDNLFGNEASTQAFKAFRKFLMHSNSPGIVLDFVRLDGVMTASIDAMRSRAHHVTENDRYGNHEPPRSHSISEGETQQEQGEDTFLSSQKGSRNSPQKGGRIQR